MTYKCLPRKSLDLLVSYILDPRLALTMYQRTWIVNTFYHMVMSSYDILTLTRPPIVKNAKKLLP